MSTAHVTLTNGGQVSVERVELIDTDTEGFLILEGANGIVRAMFTNCSVMYVLLESTQK